MFLTPENLEPVADRDVELWGGDVDLLPLLAFLRSVISSLLPKIRGAGPQAPSLDLPLGTD